MAALRGDVENANKFSNADIAYYEHKFDKLNLTDGEKASIEKSAQKFYKELDAYREKIGASAFDNTAPTFQVQQ